MPQVSIIIPVYNQLPLLLKCVQSLLSTVMPAQVEILLVDDCSPELNLTELAAWPFSMCKVTRHATNKGFAATCNTGAKGAASPLLFFLNSDTQAHPNWYEPMVRAFEDGTVGIAGPKLLFPDGNLQSCGGLFDGGRGPYHRYLGMAGDYKLANKPERVSWITGAAQMVRADLFAKIGGYDEGYKRGYFEDVDLCMKAQTMAGMTVWYEPRAVFTHHVGQSTGGEKSPEKLKEGALSFRRNSWRFHRLWDAQITPDVQRVEVNY